jgi:hypothetical protein
MGAGRAVAKVEPIELVSPPIRDLLTRCLSLDPRERPSAADLAVALG